jgi:putative Mg2+ transporter-C (MgtC) family protein
MSLTLEWTDIALRLALAFLAGILFGLNRSEHAKPAGMCTTVLVCLAASVSMILANSLITTAGKTHDSFVNLDMMRLPLGILTGMGFIGAGAIIRQGEMVRGVTTAAILWYVTILGLCFGAGQLLLGLAALAVGLFVLWVLKWFEQQLRQDRHATLVLRTLDGDPSEQEIRARVAASGYRIASWSVTHMSGRNWLRRTIRCQIWWRGRESETNLPAFVNELAQHPGVAKLSWAPVTARL